MEAITHSIALALVEGAIFTRVCRQLNYDGTKHTSFSKTLRCGAQGPSSSYLNLKMPIPKSHTGLLLYV